MSLTVSSTGRQVSPAAYAAETSPVCSPASSLSTGTQTGSSVHGSMPARLMISGGTQTSRAADPVAAFAASSRLRMVA